MKILGNRIMVRLWLMAWKFFDAHLNCFRETRNRIQDHRRQDAEHWNSRRIGSEGRSMKKLPKMKSFDASLKSSEFLCHPRLSF